jgi:AraC-like DNA-binding protein
MGVYAPALGSIWKQLEAYGIDPEPLFRKQGIDPEILFDPGARISSKQFHQVEAEAIELSGDPNFGLTNAEYARPAHLGALGFAWLASSSLRIAFERMSRYARVIQDKLMVGLEEDDDFYTVTIEANIELLNPVIREDGQLAATLKFCRVIAGSELSPSRVHLRHAEPADTSRYYEFFRCPVEFGSEATQLKFNRPDVDKRLTGSNDELASLNEHIVVRYLAHREKQDIVNQAKAAIIDGLANGSVTEKSVAESLFMTPRNLHRKLQKEETSFKLLLNEVRKDLAAQYIMDRSKTLTEISFLLGFSEVSSFSRAYKNWNGIPPSAARQDVA